jgi:hypothetical protein
MENAMDQELNLKNLESGTRQLRAEYAHDGLIRAVLALDLAIRRAAWGTLGLVRPGESRPSLQH